MEIRRLTEVDIEAVWKLRLYRSLGFEVCGLTPRALKMGNQYWDEELMALRFK